MYVAHVQQVAAVRDDAVFRVVAPIPDTAEAHVVDVCFHPHCVAHQCVQDACVPLLQFGVVPESTFELVGDVVHEDELPKQCFADTYSADSGMAVSYFRCSTCALNWLCESCTACCHRDHQVPATCAALACMLMCDRSPHFN